MLKVRAFVFFGGKNMKCPYCGGEMVSGVIQSARAIFFATKEHKMWLGPYFTDKDEVLLTLHNWSKPTCAAYRCRSCKKIVIDEPDEGNPG